MCGLVGMAGNIVDQDKKALMLLMRFDVSRGWDSTGLGVITEKEGDIHVHKQVGPPEYLFAINDNFNSVGIYTGPRGKVFIGHNRAATKGEVSNENAHPFVHDGIVGAHNGTLTSVHTLERGKEFDVDSEAIFWNLSQYDAESVINSIYGAYALTWYDDSNEKLHVIRNKERPLFWARRTDKDVVYWASEKWMLEQALRLARVSYTTINEFKENTLYTLDVSSCLPSIFRNVNWEMKDDVKGYTPPPARYIRPTGGNSGTNVIPFAPSSTNSSPSVTNMDFMMMRMMEDTEILFRFRAVKQGISGSSYILARPTNPHMDYEIRLYGDNHPSWNFWKDCMDEIVFKGRIKKAVNNTFTKVPETYFLIDLRSVRVHSEDKKEAQDMFTPADELVPEKDELSDGDPTVYEGFQGRYLTKEEWTKATSKGCAGCGGEADDHDADLIFIDHDEFLCGKNKCTEMYAEYIPPAAYK